MKKGIMFLIGMVLVLGLVVMVVGEFDDGMEYSTTLNLDKGWNLVSIYAIENIFDSNTLGQNYEDYLSDLGVKAVFFWDDYNNEYIRLYPNQEREKVERFILRLGSEDEVSDDYLRFITSSMWVYTDKQSSISYRTLDGPSPVDLLNLKSGWNFLSFTPEMTIDINSASSEEEAKYTINNIKGDCDIEKAYIFDSESKKWVTLPLNEELDDALIGLGFVVRVSEDCELGSSIASPPAIPVVENVSNVVVGGLIMPCEELRGSIMAYIGVYGSSEFGYGRCNTENYNARFDINKDGSISSIDALTIINIINGVSDISQRNSQCNAYYLDNDLDSCPYVSVEPEPSITCEELRVLIMNYLNAYTSAEHGYGRCNTEYYDARIDINKDGAISSVDAIRIVNKINSGVDVSQINSECSALYMNNTLVSCPYS
jgi:hypothetical protein